MFPTITSLTYCAMDRFGLCAASFAQKGCEAVAMFGAVRFNRSFHRPSEPWGDAWL
jgi:hypothetical protein